MVPVKSFMIPRDKFVTVPRDTDTHFGSRERDPRDPWEPMNRGFYRVNDVVDRAALRPTAAHSSRNTANWKGASTPCTTVQGEASRRRRSSSAPRLRSASSTSTICSARRRTCWGAISDHWREDSPWSG